MRFVPSILFLSSLISKGGGRGLLLIFIFLNFLALSSFLFFLFLFLFFSSVIMSFYTHALVGW